MDRFENIHDFTDFTDDPGPLSVAGAQVFSDAVKRQAAELRAAALRTASDRLDAAEEEAADIRQAASDDAARMKSEAARVVAKRLDEANEAADVLRQAAIDHAQSLRDEADQLLDRTLAGLPELRAELEQMVNRVGEVAQSLDGLQQGLLALRRPPAPESATPPAP